MVPWESLLRDPVVQNVFKNLCSPKACIFTDFTFAVPQCPIEFPALHFPTEHRPHLAFAGGCSGSVSLADSWDSSACTSLASGSGYLSPRLAAIQGSPPLQRPILLNTCNPAELLSNVAV